MIIGFTGVHGTGKTTLLKEMIGWPELAGHSFVSGLARQQKELNKLSINEHGTLETQRCLARALAWHVKRLPNMVVDRTFLDMWAYTLYHCKQGVIDARGRSYLRNLMRHNQPRFRYVFYIEPEFDVVDDGVRSTDTEFRDDIARRLKGLVLIKKTLGTRRIVQISGTVEQRLDQIRETLRKCR